uniref:Si:ch211-263p13.7 n=1 Tax=Electrophorus electricus TaxID=8005 RepID=A0A4W4FBA9_ELEEL
GICSPSLSTTWAMSWAHSRGSSPAHISHALESVLFLSVCSRFVGRGELSSKVLLKVAAPFSLLHSASEYLHLLALHHISISDSSTVLCCSQAFIFLLSWIGLKDRFMGVRIVAAILSITGIVMMSYADGFHSDSITGVALGVGSASTSAFYKVLFRKRVGQVQPGAASVLMSCEGLCSVGLHSWFCALLYISHVESWPTPQHIPWDTLCLTASLLLGKVSILNGLEVLTYPTLISLGILFTIPASVAPHTSQVRMVARAIIAAGYLMLLLPEDWDERTAAQLLSLFKQYIKNTNADRSD